MNIQSVDLEKLRFAARARLPRTGLYRGDIVEHVGFAAGDLVLHVERTVYARKIGHEDVRWPKDWWEAVKERWAPRWAKRRWPVRYAEVAIDFYHTYPGLAIHDERPTLRAIVR